MLPRQRLPPSKPSMIIRLLRPVHCPALFHLQQNATHFLQALSAPIAREKTCVAVVEGVSDAFYHARLGVWGVVAYDYDVGEEVAGAEGGYPVVWEGGVGFVVVAGDGGLGDWLHRKFHWNWRPSACNGVLGPGNYVM